jgi:hypothetical protein
VDCCAPVCDAAPSQISPATAAILTSVFPNKSDPVPLSCAGFPSFFRGGPC